MFEKLLAIQRAHPQPALTDFHRKPEGHLVQFNCGHRGQPTRMEEKRVSRLLRKSGFIPMLDDIPAAPPAKPPGKEISLTTSAKPGPKRPDEMLLQIEEEDEPPELEQPPSPHPDPTEDISAEDVAVIESAMQQELSGEKQNERSGSERMPNTATPDELILSGEGGDSVGESGQRASHQTATS